MGYREPGRRGRGAQSALLLVLAVVAVLLASIVLLAQASASESGPECREGAISAVGPVDAQGRGDSIPEVNCIEP